MLFSRLLSRPKAIHSPFSPNLWPLSQSNKMISPSNKMKG